MDYKNLLLLKGFDLNVYDEGTFWELEITDVNKIIEICKLFNASIDIDTNFVDINIVILQCRSDFTKCVFCYDDNAWDVDTEVFMKCIEAFH